jgi:hypothetical protein
MGSRESGLAKGETGKNTRKEKQNANRTTNFSSNFFRFFITGLNALPGYH